MSLVFEGPYRALGCFHDQVLAGGVFQPHGVLRALLVRCGEGRASRNLRGLAAG